MRNLNQMTRNVKLGTKLYAASYLSWDKAKERIVAAGEDPDVASIWDYCEESDIEVYRQFPSRLLALKWAKENSENDIFSMPRVSEFTYQRVEDDLGDPAGCDWERTGYWEMDGLELIEIGG